MPRVLPLAALVLAASLAGCIEGGVTVDERGGATDGPAAPAVPEPFDPRAVGEKPIQLIFGGSLRHADVQVLLVPPTHGDLGNPTAGPAVTDYLDATLRGIRQWEASLDAFAAKYPEYAYLADITVSIEILDGAPLKAGYDVLVGYVEYSGGAFRGAATQPFETQSYLDRAGLGDLARYANRYIVLSLFANSPRAGQSQADYPEVNDIHAVTMHEFAHTFGLGHTATWTHEHGADLMNSPATFVYGDGNAIGDGGERTPVQCISSLDLYGMAQLYRWMPSGAWEASSGEVESPLEYELFC